MNWACNPFQERERGMSSALSIRVVWIMRSGSPGHIGIVVTAGISSIREPGRKCELWPQMHLNIMI